MSLNKLDDKWEQQQIKVFSRWAGHKLRHCNQKINDITDEFKDGVKLVLLASVLTGKQVTTKWHQKPTKSFHYVENCDLALNLLKEDGLKLINISGADLQKGEKKLTLGFIWSCIMKYNVENSLDNSSDDESGPKHGNATSNLMNWWRKQIVAYKEIENLKPTALALCALIHSFNPSVVDYKSLNTGDNLRSAEQFVSACNALNIPVFFDAQDLVGDVDEKSLVTQLSDLKQRLTSLPVCGKPFHIFAKHQNGERLALTLTNEPYLNEAGKRLALLPVDASNPCQLWEYQYDENPSIIENCGQRGMVIDVAEADNENPPPGIPVYAFPMHGKHNQRFALRNKRLVALQNEHVVAQAEGENPFITAVYDATSKLTQELILKYH